MRTLWMILLAAGMLAAATGELPEPEPVEIVAPAPEESDELSGVLLRITQEYDPAAAGTVGAIRWAEKLLGAWLSSGESAEAALRAAALVDAGALAERLPRLQWAAEQLSSGINLGLMNEPGHKTDWTGTDTAALFAALCAGAGLDEPADTKSTS